MVAVTTLAIATAQIGGLDAAPLLAVLQQHRGLAPAVYFIAYFAANALTLPTGLLLNLGAGVLWGVAGGGLLTTFSATVFAAAAFLLSRRLGWGKSGGLDGSLLKVPAWYRRWFGNREWLLVVFLRLNPFVPFGLVSYLLGLSPIRFRTYLVATVIGNAPASFAIAAIGHAVGALTLSAADRFLVNEVIIGFTAISAIIGFAFVAERLLASKREARREMP